MSAESPRKPIRQGGHIVAPQPVSDRSIIESVAGFINEVVPQGYTSSPLTENKEQITWARFEYADINDPALYPDTTDDRNGTAPLLLVLGYGSGVQVWSIPASGEATEVLSWRQGVVRTLRVLPTPTAAVPDTFAHKRPLVALCDSSSPGPQFCSLSFISLRAGDQVKSIKFKNPVNDVLANGRSIVVSFSERIAVFDASTLEDRLTITTCYPCPGPNPNPVALGQRWLAYAERRLLPSKRCSGGTEGEGIQSYTATVLHAAKSLGKGLRELGETVASSLTGGSTPPGSRSAGFNASGQLDSAEVLHPGIVTIVDAQGTWKENGRMEDNVIAHFTAHAEAIVALQFDPSGILLVTADKRGHDFHLFRIQPHPGGSSLAAVHHLYVLHRGDTTAKVQDIAFASDSRWVAVSTLRGTTHVFPVTPYGGAVGLRTHSTPHVVNRLSRFHRSAGLTGDGRNSPQPNTQAPGCETQAVTQAMSYPNPRLPPYPHPTVVAPLAQIRQPVMHLSTPSSPNPSNAYHRNPSVRAIGRHQASLDDSGGIPLRVSACFAPSRAWLVGSPTVPRDNSNRNLKRAVDSLFVMACHGNLIEYDLETKHAAGIPKEKVCDDTPIELEAQAKAQWLLLRPPQSSEVQPPLSGMNPLMIPPTSTSHHPPAVGDISDERWLSHVEIITHAGPHRRLWMGPQFTFKTYTANTSGSTALLEPEGVDVGSGARLSRSNPVNMPISSASRPVVPYLIESGSGGSYEQSPRLHEVYGGSAGGDSDGSAGPGETQLREELADAMMESPGVPTRDTGRRVIVELQGGRRSQAIPIEKIVNPVGKVLTVITDEGSADGKTIDGENVETTVRWPTDVVKIIPKLGETRHVEIGKKLSDASISDTVHPRQRTSQNSAAVSKRSNASLNKNVIVETPAIARKQVSKATEDVDETSTKAPKLQASSEKLAGILENIDEKSKMGASKWKEMSPPSTVGVDKRETDVLEKETKRKDTKCGDKPPEKDASKNREQHMMNKPRNEKKQTPVTKEVREESSEDVPKNAHSRSSSKSSGNMSSRASVSGCQLKTSDSTVCITDCEDKVEMSELETRSTDCDPVVTDRDATHDARAHSSSYSSDGYNLEDTSKMNLNDSLTKVLETVSTFNVEGDNSDSETPGIRQRSMSRDDSEEKLKPEKETFATSVQTKPSEPSSNPWKSTSPFQSMVELPFKKSRGSNVSTAVDSVKEPKGEEAIIMSTVASVDDQSAIEPVIDEAPGELSGSSAAENMTGEEGTDSHQKTAVPDVPATALDEDIAAVSSSPVPVQRRKGKGKIAASKVISKVISKSPPKSDKSIKTQIKVGEENSFEEILKLPLPAVQCDENSESNPVTVDEQSTSAPLTEMTAKASWSRDESRDKLNKDASPPKEFNMKNLSTCDAENEHIVENVSVNQSSVRKPKKSEMLPKVKKSMETELRASQTFEESSICSLTSADVDDVFDTTANLRARKYQGLDLKDVKDLSVVESPSLVGNKRGPKSKYKPFDRSVHLALNSAAVDVNYVAQKLDVEDFPNLLSSKDVDTECSNKPNVWSTKPLLGVRVSTEHVSSPKSNDICIPDEDTKKIVSIEDVEEKSSSLSEIRFSPPKLWSSIASSKNKAEKQRCDEEVLIAPTPRSWTTMTKSAGTDEVEPSPEESSEHESNNGVDDIVTSTTGPSEQFSAIQTAGTTNDSDSPALMQANKKNNKKKNKKRR